MELAVGNLGITDNFIRTIVPVKESYANTFRAITPKDPCKMKPLTTSSINSVPSHQHNVTGSIVQTNWPQANKISTATSDACSALSSSASDKGNVTMTVSQNKAFIFKAVTTPCIQKNKSAAQASGMLSTFVTSTITQNKNALKAQTSAVETQKQNTKILPTASTSSATSAIAQNNENQSMPLASSSSEVRPSWLGSNVFPMKSLPSNGKPATLATSSRDKNDEDNIEINECAKRIKVTDSVSPDNSCFMVIPRTMSSHVQFECIDSFQSKGEGDTNENVSSVRRSTRERKKFPNIPLQEKYDFEIIRKRKRN